MHAKSQCNKTPNTSACLWCHQVSHWRSWATEASGWYLQSNLGTTWHSGRPAACTLDPMRPTNIACLMAAPLTCTNYALSNPSTNQKQKHGNVACAKRKCICCGT